MGPIEKTVFISYRRTNLPWALNIYHNLTAHGYDVFFDYKSIHSGNFEQIILSNIRARPHFLVVLTPSALERCINPNDWLRREIETALEEKRNIVPLFLEEFNFGSPAISKQLKGKLANLKNYNGLEIPTTFFSEAMDRLRNDYLNVPLDAVLHPVSASIKKEVKKQQTAANKAPKVNKKELSSQKCFEQAHKYWLNKNFNKAIQYATEAILLTPDFAEAYSRRGTARDDKGDFDGAIKDYTEAIRAKPKYADAYINRGITSHNKGDLDGAIQDYTKAIHLKAEDAVAYYNRAIDWEQKEDYYSAMADFQKYLDLGGGIRDGDQKEVEAFIRDLKKKIK